MMDAKHAVRTAKEYVADLFGDEEVSDVLLEELQLDDVSKEWKITIGFNRKSARFGTSSPLAGVLAPPRDRVYKVVAIDNVGEQVVSITDRLLPEKE
jgi:hypothetical protein